MRPVIHDGFFFRYVLHCRDGKGAVRVFPDGDTAEQAT
ncbi:host specificity J from prophage domain protein, partial [Escherichia coli 96.0932]